mmetsp:Transcript_80447/g.167591  ORF Transcript_80447/g.167591 Transcript_80447/m.167591 type:complete len:247 (+) Transcript_80447:2321-3061(+)
MARAECDSRGLHPRRWCRTKFRRAAKTLQRRGSRGCFSSSSCGERKYFRGRLRRASRPDACLSANFSAGKLAHWAGSQGATESTKTLRCHQSGRSEEILFNTVQCDPHGPFDLRSVYRESALRHFSLPGQRARPQPHPVPLPLQQLQQKVRKCFEGIFQHLDATPTGFGRGGPAVGRLGRGSSRGGLSSFAEESNLGLPPLALGLCWSFQWRLCFGPFCREGPSPRTSLQRDNRSPRKSPSIGPSG